MRLFYPTPATFPERKRKLRQCPEKLRTIGKYLSFLIRFPLQSQFFVHVRAQTHSRGELLVFLTRKHAHTHAHPAHAEPSFCCLGWVFCFGLSNKHCHAYTVKSAARALSPVRFSHTHGHVHAHALPAPAEPSSHPGPGPVTFSMRAPACVRLRTRACLTERTYHPARTPS